MGGQTETTRATAPVVTVVLIPTSAKTEGRMRLVVAITAQNGAIRLMCGIVGLHQTPIQSTNAHALGVTGVSTEWLAFPPAALTWAALITAILGATRKGNGTAVSGTTTTQAYLEATDATANSVTGVARGLTNG